MQIHVNGELRTAKDGATVADLLNEIEIRPDRVAVELNLEVLERREFESRGLCEGDRVEIISFIGGGGDTLSQPNSAYSESRPGKRSLPALLVNAEG